MRIILVIIMSFFLLGMDYDRKSYEDIRKIIEQTVQTNRQPKPHLPNRRAARMQRNRYWDNHPPIYPKTIYRQQIFPPQPGAHKRWYGGIPRG